MSTAPELPPQQVDPVELGDYAALERREDSASRRRRFRRVERGIMGPRERNGSREEIIQERRLVIGVDYGTTYTGIAFATPLASICTLEEIDVLADWGPRMGNHDKIPSVISFSEPTEQREQQWGNDLSPEAVAMVHTKLELDVQDPSEELDFILQSLEGMHNLNFQYIMESGGHPAYPEKSTEEIVTDYLTKVFKYFLRAVTWFSRELRDRISTDLVVTVPTGWSYRAMNSTYRALTQAGFNQESFPKLQDVVFVTEPEAAAIYTARYLKEHSPGLEFLRERECFVLCDAGGGTVDVVSYRVKQLDPVLELEQIGKPTARKCGSIFINMEFKKWLRSLLGEYNYHLLDPNAELNKISSHDTEGQAIRSLMNGFNQIKEDFGKSYRDVYHLDLPAPLDNLNIDGMVDDGEITITRALMSQFFDVCLGQVVNLIKAHRKLIDLRGATLKNVILVGGFGESQYLQDEVTRSLNLRRIKLRRPDTSWTAVVRGAVVCGIEKDRTLNLTRASFCRHDYGVKVDELFSDTHHDRQDLTVGGIDGVTMAQSQLMWLLSKGDVILSNSPRIAEKEITVSFTEHEARRGTVTIYKYSDDPEDRPTRFREDEVTVAHVLRYDLSKFDLSHFTYKAVGGSSAPRYYASLKLKLLLRKENLEATLTWDRNQLAREPNIAH